MVDKADLVMEMVDKWSIKPTLAEKMVDILLFMADKEEIKTETVVRAFGYTETTAKRYLRQNPRRSSRRKTMSWLVALTN